MRAWLGMIAVGYIKYVQVLNDSFNECTLGHNYNVQ